MRMAVLRAHGVAVDVQGDLDVGIFLQIALDGFAGAVIRAIVAGVVVAGGVVYHAEPGGFELLFDFLPDRHHVLGIVLCAGGTGKRFRGVRVVDQNLFGAVLFHFDRRLLGQFRSNVDIVVLVCVFDPHILILYAGIADAHLPDCPGDRFADGPRRRGGGDRLAGRAGGRFAGGARRL